MHVVRVLIKDEPTSGLDSASAFEIISCLQNTAKEYNVRTPSLSRLIVTDVGHRLDSPAVNKYLVAV